MRKFILSLFVVLLLSGCKVTYNIDFEGKDVKESFKVSLNSDEQSSIKYLKDNDFYVSFNPEMVKYDKEMKTEGNTTIFNYKHSYKIDDYKNSMALSSCFKGYSVIDEDNYYLLSTTNGVKCMTSDYSTTISELDIIINSNHKLIETNADEIKDYTYIWHINKDNYKDKNIMLKLYKDKYILNYKGTMIKNILIFGIPAVVIFIAAIYLIIKKRKSNKI